VRSRGRVAASLAGVVALAAPALCAQAGDPAREFNGVPRLAQNSPRPTQAAVAAALERAVSFLLEGQNRDGSWGGPGNAAYTDLWPNAEAHRSFTVATSGLAVMALLRHGGAEGIAERARLACDRGVAFLVAHHDLRRCDDWDQDDVWGLLYGLQGLAVALRHPWFAASDRRPAMTGAAHALAERIAACQSPTGGWGYYAEKDDAWLAQWSTSFTTAAMVNALCDARAAGVPFDAKPFGAAVRAVERCRLQSGAFTYDVMALPEPGSLEGINDVRGSLGRIQVCHLALLRGGKPRSESDLARGLDLFFRHHMYVDCARMRPIPHEAYHRNASYFYLFGHFYAGELLAHVPAAARKEFAGKLAFEVMKTQERSGASWDDHFADYTRYYGTAFAAMALGSALDALVTDAP